MGPRETLSPDFADALISAGLRDFWNDCTPAHHRQYLEWIGSAKRPETRAERIRKALVMIASKRDEEAKKAKPKKR